MIGGIVANMEDPRLKCSEMADRGLAVGPLDECVARIQEELDRCVRDLQDWLPDVVGQNEVNLMVLELTLLPALAAQPGDESDLREGRLFRYEKWKSDPDGFP